MTLHNQIKTLEETYSSEEIVTIWGDSMPWSNWMMNASSNADDTDDARRQGTEEQELNWFEAYRNTLFMYIDQVED